MQQNEPEPDADKAALIAAEIDQLSYDYDTVQYRDTVEEIFKHLQVNCFAGNDIHLCVLKTFCPLQNSPVGTKFLSAHYR